MHATCIDTLNRQYYEDYGRFLCPLSIQCYQHWVWQAQPTNTPFMSADSDGTIVSTWKHGMDSVSLSFKKNTILYASVIQHHTPIREYGKLDLNTLVSYPFYHLICSTVV